MAAEGAETTSATDCLWRLAVRKSTGDRRAGPQQHPQVVAAILTIASCAMVVPGQPHITYRGSSGAFNRPSGGAYSVHLSPA
jgi:hypothetical protein